MRPLDEVDLPQGSLVIADLHLLPDDATSYEAFVAWLAQLGRPPRLIVLGDLFEYWVGPAQARWEGPRRVLEALAARVAAGTAVDVLHGNRDFLLDRSFERASGCRVRPGGLVGRTAGGGRVLFVHGDELATLDVAYQRLRRVIRSAPIRWLARGMPRWASERVARRLRHASRQAVAAKPTPAMALQPPACEALAELHRASLVVCGHAHRYRDQALSGGGRWVVLDAYGGERDLLEVGEGGAFEVRPHAGAAVGG